MGYLAEGRWVAADRPTKGAFIRGDTQFRNWITPDGSSGPSGAGGFKAEADRYHLYVSLACPWASRTLIFRSLKGLETMIGLSVTHWLMGENGWTFTPGEGVIPDTVVLPLFETLGWLEERLSQSRFLVGDKPTEADWRLFTTLVRFDAVYHGHFKCNIRRLVDYPNLWPYTRDLYQWPGVAQTVNLTHTKRHYYMSHRHINPTGIVPMGPEIDFSTPDGRASPPR